MKEFLVYTAMRLGLFIGSYALISGLWVLVSGDDAIPILLPFVLAFVLSGIASYFLLNRQREAFAQRVQTRAERASAKFEELRAKEDAD